MLVSIVSIVSPLDNCTYISHVADNIVITGEAEIPNTTIITSSYKNIYSLFSLIILLLNQNYYHLCKCCIRSELVSLKV